MKAEFLNHANDMITRKLYETLNFENGNCKPEANIRNFKFFVGQGNNAKIVKEIISRRGWW